MIDLGQTCAKIDEFFSTPAGPLLDAESVSAIVCKHARKIGCTDSNATAAVAWGIRYGHDTLSAIRTGKARAEQLRERELRAAMRGAGEIA